MNLSNLMVGGSLWINLTNTLYLKNGEKQDLLDQPHALMQWLVENQLLSESPEAQAFNIDFLTDQLKTLRNICQTILTTIELRQLDMEPLNPFLSSFELHVELCQEQDHVYTRFFAKTKEEDILYQIAISVADTLMAVPLERVRKCEHEECILHFVDTSKAGKRRWCSMETCGNRHKASEFYRKKRGQNEKGTN